MPNGLSRTAPLLISIMVLLALWVGRAFADDEKVWAALKQGGGWMIDDPRTLASAARAFPNEEDPYA